MQALPLFLSGASPQRGGLAQAVDAALPTLRNVNCNLCALGSGKKQTCLPPIGDPGGTLVVLPPPRMGDVSTAASGKLNEWVRDLRRKIKGPLAVVHALGCAPGKMDVGPAEIDACRGYLAGTITALKPRTVIAAGYEAALAVTGRGFSAPNLRRSYAHLEGGVVVHLLSDPASPNRFVQRWAKEDLARIAANAAAPLPDPRGLSYSVVETEADALEAEAALVREPLLSLDCEWAGKVFSRSFVILCAGLANADGSHAYVWSRQAMERPESRAAFLRLAQGKPLLGHQLKADINALRSAYGWMDFQTPHGDTQLWYHLLDTEVDADLDSAAEMAGMGGYKSEAEAARKEGIRAMQRYAAKANPGGQVLDLFGGGAIKRKIPGMPWLAPDEVDRQLADSEQERSFALIPPEVLHRYNARDVIATSRLGLLLEDRIDASRNLRRVWQVMIQPGILAYAKMEFDGVRIDLAALRLLTDYAAQRKADVLAKLAPHGPPGINWDSNDQVRALLFETLGLKPVGETESGAASLDAKSLEKMKDQHAIIPLLLENTKVTTLQKNYAGRRTPDGKYVDGFWQHIREDGRIHTDFNLDGARSGRLSTRDPNLQSTQRAETHEGKLVKDVFIADSKADLAVLLKSLGYSEEEAAAQSEDSVLVGADYGQLEYRVMAERSGDPNMRQAVAEGDRTGEDFHWQTARLVAPFWGLKPEEVKKPQRQAAKGVNFGVSYQMGDESLAAVLKSTVAEAVKIKNFILGKYAQLPVLVDNCGKLAESDGISYTYWENEPFRERNLYLIGSPDSYTRGNAKRASFNTTIQGEASDYCMQSVIRLQAWIKANRVPAKLLLSVHDSVIFTCPRSWAARLGAKIREIMEGYKTAVRLAVDIDWGPAWGSITKMEGV